MSLILILSGNARLVIRRFIARNKKDELSQNLVQSYIELLNKERAMTNDHCEDIYKVETIFNEDFSHWNISLPRENLQQRKRGKINKAGWAIWYLFGSDEKGEYLDYYSSHRMTNDSHVRIYFDGTSHYLPSIESMRLCSKDPEEDSKLGAEFHRKNENVARMLEEKGFGLSGDEPGGVQIQRYVILNNPPKPKKTNQ